MKKKDVELKAPTNNSFIDKWVEELELNSENLKKVLGRSDDFIIRTITVNEKANVKVNLAFMDGLNNHDYISNYILKPLVNDIRLVNVKDEEMLFDYIQQGLLYYSAQDPLKNMSETVDAILGANVVIVFDGIQKAFSFDTKGFQMRGISPPTEETSIRGSKDTFVETIRVNTATIRRKIKSTSLIIEDIEIGSMSNTLVSVVYMDNMVNKESLNELKNRLASIDTEEVLFAGVIEEHIIENRNASFPQVDYTEKPDKFSIGINDGKIGIIIDGIPFAILLPVTVADLFQSTDDYSNNQFMASIVRVIRYALASISLLLPGFFISVTTFHHQLLPTALAVSIISSREGVSLPIFFEVFILVIAFQVLIEAGTRIYSSIGSMISLVGAIVVGDAAIGAKLVSPASVVIVAIAAISNYAIPNRDFANSIWIYQLLIILLSSMIGLFGLAIGLTILIFTLSSIEVLGVPYLSPFVNSNSLNMFKDTIIRPSLDDKKNPEYLHRIK